MSKQFTDDENKQIIIYKENRRKAIVNYRENQRTRSQPKILDFPKCCVISKMNEVKRFQFDKMHISVILSQLEFGAQLNEKTKLAFNTCQKTCIFTQHSKITRTMPNVNSIQRENVAFAILK